MKRIALIRSIDVKQAQPMLFSMSKELSKFASLKLFYSDGECGKKDFCGEFEHFENSLSLVELADKVLSWNPDVVISISIPDNNALRDAVLADYLKIKGVNFIAHPIHSTLLLSNKWETTKYLKSMGVSVPKTVYASGDLISNRVDSYSSIYVDVLINELNNLEFPLIAKPLWDSMSQGIKILKDMEETRSFLSTLTVDYIFQEYILGELLGIETITHNENVYFQPLVRKYTSENLVPFDHLRYGPYNGIPKVLLDRMKKKIRNVCLDLKLNGSIEFEMIYDRKANNIYILEINPRISGMTNLSSLISGVNSYTLLGQIEKIDTMVSKERYVAEVPLRKLNDEFIEKIKKINEIESIQSVSYHTGKQQVKTLIASDSLSQVIKTIFLLNEYGLIPNNIMKECLMLNEMSQSD